MSARSARAGRVVVVGLRDDGDTRHGFDPRDVTRGQRVRVQDSESRRVPWHGAPRRRAPPSGGVAGTDHEVGRQVAATLVTPHSPASSCSRRESQLRTRVTPSPPPIARPYMTGRPEGHGPRAERQRDEHVGRWRTPPSRIDLGLLADGLDDARQRVERRDLVRELAAAVVGDHDPPRAGVDGAERVVAADDALGDHRQRSSASRATRCIPR